MPELASKTQQIASMCSKVNLWTKKNKPPWKATKTSFKWNKHRGNKLEKEEVVEAGPSFEGAHSLHPPVQIRQDERKGSGLCGRESMKGSWPRDGSFIIHIRGALSHVPISLLGKLNIPSVLPQGLMIFYGQEETENQGLSLASVICDPRLSICFDPGLSLCLID